MYQRLSKITHTIRYSLNMQLQFCCCHQWAECTNPCLIQHIINSLSSCVCCWGGEMGYRVCKEQGSVFEVLFCKSLEDNRASGWTHAVGREATTIFPLWGQKLVLVTLAMLSYPCYLFMWNNTSHQKHNVSRLRTTCREKTQQFSLTEAECNKHCLALCWNMGSEQHGEPEDRFLQPSAVYDTPPSG